MSEIDLSNYRVAAVQMDIVPGQMEQNRDHAVTLAKEAIRRGSRLIVFPELSDIDMVIDSRGMPTTVPGPYTAPFEALAAQHGIHFVIGMSRCVDNRYFNSAVFIGPHGYIGAYDKVHVWAGDWDTDQNDWTEDPRRIEPYNYLPGNEFKVFDVDGITVGAMICYDGLFAESWLCNRLLGADLLVWPTNRGAYADMNVPVLAKYFQLNVMAVNRFGQSSYWTQGDSQVISAQGQVLAHAFNGESVLLANLNIKESRKWRRSELEMRDRRPEVYAKYLAQTPQSEIAPGMPSWKVTPKWKQEK